MNTVLNRSILNLTRLSSSRKRRLVLGSALAVAARLFCAELEQQALFTAGQGGYHAYRIPAIVATTNGTLLAFCEGRWHSAADSGAVDLVLRRSLDHGRTWTPLQIVWSDGTNTCGNPAPLCDPATGVVWLLATWNLGADTERAINEGTSRDTRRVFELHSSDQGLTWSPPRELTKMVKPKTWRWYATGPVNGICLTRGAHRGRLVIPANHSQPGTNQRVVSRSHVIYSDDHGKTWKVGGSDDEQTNESTLLERSDGSLLQNMRSLLGQHRRAEATSADGGLSWSAARLQPDLVEPVCQASLLRYTWPGSGEKSRVLFCNPASLRRERLTIRLSYDEGATWPLSRTLYAGPSAYSCLVALSDARIGCLFECGERGPYDRIVFACISPGWLEHGP